MSGPQMTKALGVGAQSLQKHKPEQQSISSSYFAPVNTAAQLARALGLLERGAAEFECARRVLGGAA